MSSCRFRLILQNKVSQARLGAEESWDLSFLSAVTNHSECTVSKPAAVVEREMVRYLGIMYAKKTLQSYTLGEGEGGG